ncbi:MAG TPA: MBL fold metallo-hydrolase [Alphaproteobacteria bacterium]|nr:MBL fold metallo-hydrolase [Alphaproteobacteria bacterium]
MRLTFLGATGTVTGSKYLLEAAGLRILIDCGLFQGYKELRLRNWEPLPIAPRDIDWVVLTHAHIDHSGYLPLFVRNGFKGRVLCTSGTRDLCGILLPDSGFLQEQDAAFANRHGTSKHHPALPLYTRADAEEVLPRLDAVAFGAVRDLGGGLTLSFQKAGHILGAASVRLHFEDKTVLFSGDLGRPNDPIMPPAEPIGAADYLVVESTYGDRDHGPVDPAELLADIVNRTAARGGTVVIPAFAVGRAQLLLYYLARLKSAGRIPNLPIFLDSPMAIEAGQILFRHDDDHRLSEAESLAMRDMTRETPSVEESMALDRNHMPKIIISASGMATGGRILHHLKRYAPGRHNTIVFAGYQAGGTRGAAMVGGANEIKIFGEYIPVRAEVVNLDMLSAHADRGELIDWLRTCRVAPRNVFVTHGEPAAADGLRRRISEELHWPCRVPTYRDTVELT